jgi:leucyl aminopeptidase
MEDMKIDMAGSAAVLGLFSVLPDLAPPVEVHGVIAATENMPSGTAIRPGDVLHSMKGKTIEVLNTDAEGRLTLADALAFACRQGVEEIVDLATLTGACMIALGAATGLWGRPDSYRDKILEAAGLAGDRTWPMPLVDDYREQLKSQVADIKNVAGRGGGAITAALFLREFVDEGVEWCHMDIAGSASTEKDLPTCPTGGTGAGVGTLIRHLETFMEE